MLRMTGERLHMGRGRCWRLAAAALCLVLISACPAYAANSELGAAKKKVTSIEEEKKKVEKTLKDLESLKADTAAYVSSLDSSVDELMAELEELDAMIGDKSTEIEKARAELEEAVELEAMQYEDMKLRIKYMYEKGQTTFLDLLFEARDMTQLLNRADYITSISQYDREMLDQYGALKEEIAVKKEGLETEQQELLAMQQSTQAKKESMELLIAEKSQEIQAYETKIASAEERLDEYEADLKAQEARIRQIEAEIKRREEEAKKAAEAMGKTYNTASIGNIKFIWPCPASSRITSAFGARSSPTKGASTNHKGIDIGAPTGSDIVASAAGEVIISTYSYSAGNYIMVNHGGGVYSVYMHCSRLLASVGDQVTQGQVIAKVGSTGYSTGPHLHFGIRVDGNYVNPSNYVSP